MFSQIDLVIFYFYFIPFYFISSASSLPLISRYLGVPQNTPTDDEGRDEKCSKMKSKTMPFSFPAVIFLEDSEKGI